MKKITKIMVGAAFLLAVTPVLALTFIKDGKVKTEAYTIVDKSKESGVMCAQALQKFYEDDKNEYYYSCIKDDLVIVEYSNGTSETVSEALKKGKISIDELDDYGIKYYIEEK